VKRKGTVRPRSTAAQILERRVKAKRTRVTAAGTTVSPKEVVRATTREAMAVSSSSKVPQEEGGLQEVPVMEQEKGARTLGASRGRTKRRSNLLTSTTTRNTGLRGKEVLGKRKKGCCR